MVFTPDFELATSPDSFRRCAAALSRGRGPFALDTERASAYRYDDRAFLVQVHRRGSGTFLFAPEGHRDALRDALAPVLNGKDWILHASGEDLPSLADLGLQPGTLFDTELAGRLAGFSRPNLAAMVTEFVGVDLEKGYGREDWSQVPLPHEWQVYAAFDVIYLNDLAEAQAEYLDARGKLALASVEFEHLTRRNRARPGKTWRDLKGVSALPEGESLHVARELFRVRDTQARQRDVAPGSLLPSKVLVDIARTLPETPSELARLGGFPRRRRGAVEEWFDVVRDARRVPRDQWPLRDVPDSPVPGKSAWQRLHPDSWAALLRAREAVAARAAELSMLPEVLVQSSVLRQVVWDVTEEEAWRPPQTDTLVRRLACAGAREWQAEAVASSLARALRS